MIVEGDIFIYCMNSTGRMLLCIIRAYTGCILFLLIAGMPSTSYMYIYRVSIIVEDLMYARDLAKRDRNLKH